MVVALSVLTMVQVSAQTSAEGDAQQRVAQLSQAMKALGGYAVRFTITVGDYKASGDYVVGGERYSLSLGNVEIYGDAMTRYEVDKSRREVVIDKVDPSSNNILSNPASAFDFIGDEYLAEVASESASSVTLTLTPRESAEQDGVISLTIDKKSALPKSIVYRPSGESIKVDIESVVSTSAAPKAYQPNSFDGFEIIDFR